MWEYWCVYIYICFFKYIHCVRANPPVPLFSDKRVIFLKGKVWIPEKNVYTGQKGKNWTEASFEHLFFNFFNCVHFLSDTVDGRNPARVDTYILFFHMALYIPGGAGFLLSTVPPAASSMGPNRIQMDFAKWLSIQSRSNLVGRPLMVKQTTGCPRKWMYMVTICGLYSPWN